MGRTRATQTSKGHTFDRQSRKPLKASKTRRYYRQQLKRYLDAVCKPLWRQHQRHPTESTHELMHRLGNEAVPPSLSQCMTAAKRPLSYCLHHDNVCQHLENDAYPYIMSPNALALLRDAKAWSAQVAHDTVTFDSVTAHVIKQSDAMQHSRVQHTIMEALRGQQWCHPSVAVQRIQANDKRVALRGQRGVFATRAIEAGTLLGMYCGALMTEKDYTRYCHRRMNATKLAYIRLYCLSIDHGELVKSIDKKHKELIVLPVGGTNMMHLLNDARTNPMVEDKRKRHHMQGLNAHLCSFVINKRLYAGVITTQDVNKNEELLVDYGKSYWDEK